MPAKAPATSAAAPAPTSTPAQTGPWLLVSDFVAASKRFAADTITDHAAAMTYYSLLALFPALLFSVGLLGLIGQEGLVTDATVYLKDAGAPAETVDAVSGAIESAQAQQGTALGALLLGSVIALNGASGAFAAAGRALNVIFRVSEGRGVVHRKLTDVGWTVLVLVLAVLSLMLVLLGGGLARDVLGLIGLGENATAVWQFVRWPAALCVAMGIYAIIYRCAPNVAVRRWRLITPGAVVGVSLWLLASGGFFVYVSNFSSYSATYGAFAGAVILLVWLWLTNVVLLFGAELNVVIDTRRAPHLPPAYDGLLLPVKEPADASGNGLANAPTRMATSEHADASPREAGRGPTPVSVEPHLSRAPTASPAPHDPPPTPSGFRRRLADVIVVVAVLRGAFRR